MADRCEATETTTSDRLRCDESLDHDTHHHASANGVDVWWPA